MSRLARLAVVTAAAGAIGATALATPAAAIPPNQPGRSTTYTYYSSAAHSTVVGGWSYGSCGAPFDWGTHTGYFTIYIVNCGS